MENENEATSFPGPPHSHLFSGMARQHGRKIPRHGKKPTKPCLSRSFECIFACIHVPFWGRVRIAVAHSWSIDIANGELEIEIFPDEAY